MDGSNRNGTKVGLRGRGGRGMLMGLGPSNKEDETTNDSKIDQSADINCTENFESPLNSDINKSKPSDQLNADPPAF